LDVCGVINNGMGRSGEGFASEKLKNVWRLEKC